MESRVSKSDRLDGWDAIAQYLGWHTRTVIRWEKQKGLPVHRVGGGKRAPVFAYREELDLWFKQNVATSSAPSNAAVGDAVTVIELSPSASDQADPPRPSSRPLPRWISYTFGMALIILLVVAAIALRYPRQPHFQISSVRQLTADDNTKHHLVTDGKTLYFSERIGDEDALSVLPVGGGAMTHMSLPVMNPVAQDITSDGRRLLVLSWDSIEEDHPLWVVPTDGEPPTRVRGVTATAAAWAPWGDVVFFRDNAVYLSEPDGSHTRVLTQLAGFVQQMVWSEDGGQLVLSGDAAPNAAPSLWRIDLDSERNLKHVANLYPANGAAWEPDRLARVGGVYLCVSQRAGRDELVAVNLTAPFSTATTNVPVQGAQFEVVDAIAAGASGKEIFILSAVDPHEELVRYDPATRNSRELLPGSSAVYADFSPDGREIAYVRRDDDSLWISNADGSAARKLSPPGMLVELPRWSPDGKSVAFSGKPPDRPYRVFLLDAGIGETTLREASHGEDNQGAPTWSPDERFLVYGNVKCEQDKSCAIHRIDLASGAVTTLPGSQGFTTARWSPNGQYIAALNGAERELWIYEIKRQAWRRLAVAINGNDVSWSSDSHFAYTKSSMGGQTEILRVPAKGGKVETVLDLTSSSKSEGTLDTWFGLTRDNAIMVTHVFHSSEIYELSYDWR